jgi:hypothetical protein
MHPRVLLCFVLETTSLPISSIQIKIFCILGWGECLLLGAYSLNFVLEEWEVYPQLNQQTFQLHTHIDG